LLPWQNALNISKKPATRNPTISNTDLPCYPLSAAQGGHVPWLLHAVQQVAAHPGVYITAEAVEEMLGPHHIARVEALATAALTR
jgi:hypothetical protein